MIPSSLRSSHHPPSSPHHGFPRDVRESSNPTASSSRMDYGRKQKKTEEQKNRRKQKNRRTEEQRNDLHANFLGPDLACACLGCTLTCSLVALGTDFSLAIPVGPTTTTTRYVTGQPHQATPPKLTVRPS